MPNNDSEETVRRILTRAEDAELEERAPSRLKARIFSGLIREQQTTGPLQNLSATWAAGHQLCMFEKLVHLAPLGERAKVPFFCWACSARVVAEHVEHAPVFWPHCPYADFQKP